MKSGIATLSLAAGLIVSAAALYQSHDSQQEACISLQKAAERAAQAPIIPSDSQHLGFTPMTEFTRAYQPACQPPNTSADVFSSLVGGAVVGFICFVVGSIVARIYRRTPQND